MFGEGGKGIKSMVCNVLVSSGRAVQRRPKTMHPERQARGFMMMKRCNFFFKMMKSLGGEVLLVKQFEV